VVFVFMHGLNAFAQNVQILNKNTGLPVANATILYRCNFEADCQNKPGMLQTDSIGNANPPQNNALAITVKCMGFYDYKTIKYKNSNITIKLEPNPNYLQDLVVTGQYAHQTADNSVFKIKVIDGGQIKKQGAFNLQQVLANQLNIRILQDPILGGGIQIQGVSGNNIKFLIDGVPVIGREGGNIDLGQINLNNTERIEIVEGPMSVNFGTDALGGVINIITKANLKNKTHANASVYYETIGQYNADAMVTFNKNHKALSAGIGRNFFEGFSPVKNTRTALWKPRTQYNAFININKNITDGNIKFNNSLFTEKITSKGEAEIDWTGAKAQDQYFYTTRFSSSFFYNKTHQQKRKIDAVISYNFYQRTLNTYLKDLVTLNQELIPSSYNHDTTFFHNLMSRGTYANTFYSLKLKYQVGYEMNADMAVGSKIANNTNYITDVSVFGSTEYLVNNNILIKPALRYTYNNLFTAPLIPSLNIKTDLTENLTLRASYGKGFRAPSIKEIFLEMVDVNHNIRGNKNLIPETSNNIQAFLMFKKQTPKHKITVEPGLFYNAIFNMIDLARSGNGNNIFMQYVNINNFKSTGINVTTDYRNKYVNASFGYAYTGRKSIINNSNAANWYYTNEFRFNAGYTFTNNLSVNVFLKHNGFMQGYQYNYFNGNVELNYINPFTIADLTLNKSLFNNSLNITAGSKNLLNVTNINATFLNGYHGAVSNFAMAGFGRTYFVCLTFNFGNPNE